MVNHKRFTCENCGVFWKIKSRVMCGEQELCIRCYRSCTSFRGLSRANKEAAIEWKATHKRRAYSYQEEKVLRIQYAKDKLSESQIKERLGQLKFKVLENSKKVYFMQKAEKGKRKFASEFAKLVKKQ